MLYRVAQRSLFRNINTNLGFLTWDMAKYNNQMSTGKKVNKPSDDPAGGATILSMRTVIADLTQYNKDVALADDWLKTTESVLQQMKLAVERADVLAEQMATDTYTAENMMTAAEEVSQLFESLINMGNTRIGERYIFAGQSTDTQPFHNDLQIWDTYAAAGNSTSFTGEVLTQGNRIFNYRPDIPRETQQFVVEITSAGGILEGTSGYTLANLTLDPAGDHNSIFFQAQDNAAYRGSSGNAVNIVYSSALAGGTTTVSVAGTTITVNLAVSAGNIVSTANDVISAINTHATASGMVYASLTGGNSGNGYVRPTSTQSLDFGYDGPATYRVSQDGGQTWSVSQAFYPDDLRNNDLVWNTELGHSSLTTHMTGYGNDLYFVADNLGNFANDIRVSFVDDQSPGQPVSVEVGPANWDITVHLETSSVGILTTANDIVSAINNHASASNLITAGLADYGEGGNGFVSTMELTPLSNNGSEVTALGHAGLATNFNYTPPGDPNPNIEFTALQHGTSGNNILVTFTSAVVQSVTTVTQNFGPPPQVVVNLASSAGSILSTTQDVIDAITSAYVANPASALVTASYAEWPAGKAAVVSTFTSAQMTGGDPALNEKDHGINIRFEPDGSALQAGDRFSVNVSYYTGDGENLDVNADQSTRVKSNTPETRRWGPPEPTTMFWTPSPVSNSTCARPIRKR